MSDSGDRRVVKVATPTEALCDPTFVIKFENKYYTTLALWEYDPHAPNLTPEQRRDVGEVERLYGEERDRGNAHEAVKVGASRHCYFTSTDPSGGHH